MKYTVTIHYRGADLTPSVFTCDGLEDVFQTIADALQITKDHWNTTSVSITWEPPATYAGAAVSE